MKCLLLTILPHSNMGWLDTQDNKLANIKATRVQLFFFHVTWRAKFFFASILGIYEIWECSGPKIVKSLAVLSAWQQRKYFDTSAEPSHKHTVLEAPWKWWSLCMNTLTHKHKHTHMNEKQTFSLKMASAFFLFIFEKTKSKSWTIKVMMK